MNTSRGEVIDENALARLLEAGEIAGAGLDVFEHEPAVNPKLVKLAREGKVVLLPHMGSATVEGRIDMGEKVIINIKTFMDGHRPPDRVLPEHAVSCDRRSFCLKTACASAGLAPDKPSFDAVASIGLMLRRTKCASRAWAAHRFETGATHPPQDEAVQARVNRQIPDRRFFAAERIVFVPRIAQRLEAHRARVDHQEPADQALAEADDLADHFQRHHRAEHARQRAENAGFRASGNRALRRRLGKQAAIGRVVRAVGARLMRAEVVSEPSKVPTAAVTSGFFAK